jgi:hypothetical protein
MVFAHLQCFFHEYLDECIYKIKNSRRSINDDIFGSELNSENTDIKYKDANGNTFLPPFFAYYQFKDEEQQKELAYPDMYDIEEVRLVTRLLNSTKQFSEEYNKIANEIIELSETDTHYNDEETINTSGLPINFDGGFIPSSYYDIFYGDKNPYSYIDTNTPTLIKDIFYVFILRYYALTMLNAKTDKDEFLNNEVGNIVECFTDLKQYMLTETFDRGQDGAKLYEYMNDYSKKRIVPIDNLDIPKKEIFKKLLLLTRIDTSSTYSDAEREIALQNTHENTFDFINGIKVLNDCEYAKFETLKGVLENNKLETQKSYILYDNTEYIKDNKGASKNAHHKILKTKPINDVNVTATILTSEGVNQLPIGEECNQYTLPFTLAASKGNSGTLTYQNLLYHLSKGNKLKFSNDKELDLSKLDNVGKGFFILSSLIVSIQDIRDSFNSKDTSANDILGNKICKTRKIIPLFYGCLLYLFRKKFIEDIDIVPNLITIDARDGERIDQAGSFHVNLCITENSELNGNTGFFRYDYQTVQVSDNKNSKVIVTLIKQLLCSYSEKHVEKKFKPDDVNNKVIHEIFLEKNGLTALEEYFLKETKDNGIIQEIITSAKEENTFNGNIQIDGFSLNGIEIYPITGKTSNALVRLMSETVCTIATNYRTEKLQDKDTFQDIEFKNSLEKRLEIFYKKLYNVCKKEEKTKEVEEYNTSDTQLNVDVKISLYYTLKSLYDKWICSYGNMERFQLNKLEYDEQTKDNRFKKGTQVNNKSEINNFLFVDSLYRDIGKNFICDPSSLIKITMNCFEGQNNFSVYQFLHLLCQENKLLMRAVPVYNNFYEEDGLKEVFTPKDVFNINQSQENAFSSTYLIMYTHQPSVHLNNPNSGYNDDSIYIGNDIGRTIVTKDFEKIFMDKNKGYLVPTFGVTYGMQNQSYFKGININMDNPITTDYSIANQLMLSQTAASSGDLNLPIGIGQNIYSIYSNRSYNCTVEMMGCANIMPMMYFQLNNIPMFKGVYMIVSVKHSIRSGNMTTTFTGVRQTSIIYPFVNSGLILTSILDKFNGAISYKSSTEIESPTEEIVSPDRKGSSTEIKTPKTSQIGIEANIIKSQYYNLAIHNGSLVDNNWMEARRKYWRDYKDDKKNKPYAKIGNTYWGYANNGKIYPLNYIKNRKIDYIILHMANTPDSTFDKGTNNFRALNMRNGWFGKWVTSRGKTKVSADFGVDDKHIVQFTPDYKDYAGFSCTGNISGISIEMCNNFTGTKDQFDKYIPNRPQYKFSEGVLENTKKLIIEIFLQIGPKNITTHYRREKAAGERNPKPCPGVYGWNPALKNNSEGKVIWENGKKVKNNEDELDKFVESVWVEWVKVAQEKGREVGTKIKIV